MRSRVIEQAVRLLADGGSTLHFALPDPTKEEESRREIARENFPAACTHPVMDAAWHGVCSAMSRAAEVKRMAKAIALASLKLVLMHIQWCCLAWQAFGVLAPPISVRMHGAKQQIIGTLRRFVSRLPVSY